MATLAYDGHSAKRIKTDEVFNQLLINYLLII
jgi:hypothetical protein